jgi:hypothetical protein
MASFVERGVKTDAGYAATRPMEKRLHTQPVPSLRMAQQFAGAGLKIVTDIAGRLGPFVLIGERRDQQRSAWDLVQLRARRGRWRKCLTVVGMLRPGFIQWSAGLDPALAGIHRAISSSHSYHSRPVELRWVKNASSGGHTYATPARRDLIVISLPTWGWTYCCLSDHVNYKLQGYLNVLGAS